MTVVWVTGAKGFIGQNLIRYLVHHDQTVSGLGHGALPPETAKIEGISHWINGDIDAYNLQQLLKQAGKPDCIYHLAGGSSVGMSLQVPAEDFRRSVIATSNLLEWARIQIPNVRIVITSSAAVYGNNDQEKIPEFGCYTPFSPYGFHKRATELLCESYAQAFSLKIAIVRLFSVYGPGLRKQLLWELCCRLQLSPEVLQLHGTGDELRDWLYIDDAAKILVQAGQLSSASPFIVNGATGKGICVRDVAKLLCKIWGSRSEITFSGKQHAGNPFSLVADTRYAQEMGIEAQCELSDGLEKYVDWFRHSQKV
ncbi:NAD(P)-dependent oxidoreductase [Acaryochloris sp. 'Moss Beach']|uniref:NAD-dependent epimerase/dehydratase family protein n=1 Tax=Acaryochloris sp. 'Moss Beach' TaxID=2740837 RepID=UPI001F1D548E|nr:NAD(P)-dependent oxidoreductase [Acaryochloris sp. 'Moss Beach']UJB67901.1 NAD(P)-dependent oxidoreductase [Acaryochloris sp. 'Moss Beach']